MWDLRGKRVFHIRVDFNVSAQGWRWSATTRAVRRERCRRCGWRFRKVDDWSWRSHLGRPKGGPRTEIPRWGAGSEKAPGAFWERNIVFLRTIASDPMRRAKSKSAGRKAACFLLENRSGFHGRRRKERRSVLEEAACGAGATGVFHLRCIRPRAHRGNTPSVGGDLLVFVTQAAAGLLMEKELGVSGQSGPRNPAAAARLWPILGGVQSQPTKSKWWKI